MTGADVTQVGWLVSSPAAVTEEDEESGEDTSSYQTNTQHGEIHLGEDHRSIAASESEEEVHGRHSSLVRENSQVMSGPIVYIYQFQYFHAFQFYPRHYYCLS